MDQCILDCKNGKIVFDEEKKAVKHLMKIKTPSIEILNVIVEITNVDRTLAEVAGEADPTCNPDKVGKEMDKGDTCYDEGKYDKAIGHYKKAWQRAIQCVCKSSSDDMDEDEDLE